MVTRRHQRFRCRGALQRQRGAFAVMALVLLFTVVAMSLQFLLRSTQSSHAATVAYSQSDHAFDLADSALEIAYARLRTYRMAACNGSAMVGANVDRGSFSYDSVSTVAALPVSTACDSDGLAPACVVSARGIAGESTRRLNLEAALCAPVDAGVSGFGGSSLRPISQSVLMEAPNAVVVTNLAFRRMDVSGGSATFSACSSTASGSCALAAVLSSSSGPNAVGGIVVAVPASSGATAAPVSYTATTTLSADRTFSGVGAIFEGRPAPAAAVAIAGSYGRDTGGGSNDTTGVSETDMGGEVTDGTTGWCKDADTLVFSFAARPKSAGQRLASVRFGVEGGRSALLQVVQRFTSADGAVSAEVWYLHGDTVSGGLGSLFVSGGRTPFSLMTSTGSISDWVGIFTCLRGVNPSIKPRGTTHMRPVNWWESF